MTGLARDQGVAGLGPLVLAPPTRPARPGRGSDVARELAAPALTDQAAPMPAPSMRGLEAMIAIGSLAAALLLGLLR